MFVQFLELSVLVAKPRRFIFMSSISQAGSVENISHCHSKIASPGLGKGSLVTPVGTGEATTH